MYLPLPCPFRRGAGFPGFPDFLGLAIRQYSLSSRKVGMVLERDISWVEVLFSPGLDRGFGKCACRTPVEEKHSVRDYLDA